jgi:hypothetical protein
LNTREIMVLLCVFIGVPIIVLGFIHLQRRCKDRIEAIRLKKEMLALEVEKERLRQASMAEDHRKYEHQIEAASEPAAKT